MNDNKDLYTEEAIIGAVKQLLTGKTNDILKSLAFEIPVIEFGNVGCGYALVPVIELKTCERTEKERIIFQDTYMLTISFSVADAPESEGFCYAYLGAIQKALSEDVTLGGTVDRAVIVGKKYNPPKKLNCGLDWEIIISLRITIDSL